MFPRPVRDDTRYRPELAEAVYWVMTVAGAALFVVNMWWRVRMPAVPSPSR